MVCSFAGYHQTGISILSQFSTMETQNRGAPRGASKVSALHGIYHLKEPQIEMLAPILFLLFLRVHSYTGQHFATLDTVSPEVVVLFPLRR